MTEARAALGLAAIGFVALIPACFHPSSGAVINNPTSDSGGGGGGGGVGIIKILSPDPGTTSDLKKVSPPPS